MNIDTLNEMGIYILSSLIHQLQGLNKALWTYVNNECEVTIHDKKLRSAIETISEVVAVEEAVLKQTDKACDDLIDALENFDMESGVQE